MGTRQELGIFVVVIALMLVAWLDGGPPASTGREQPATSGVCPMEEKDLAGVDCVLLGFRIPVNRAEAADLTVVPGIGEVLAGRIIQAREKTGGFVSLDDLLEVRGIGEKRLEVLGRYLVVDAPKPRQEAP